LSAGDCQTTERQAGGYQGVSDKAEMQKIIAQVPGYANA
jgi:hypothetical protein